MSNRTIVIVLLLCVWLYLAYDAFKAGNTVLALIFLAAGAALTAYRLRRR